MAAPREKTGKKFTPTEREAVLCEVAKLDASGFNQFDIARAVGVTQPQVSNYLKEVRERYKVAIVAERGEQVAKKLDQYRHVMRENWQAWERSKVDVKPIVNAKTGKVKRVEVPVNPNPAFLRNVLDCLKAERDLLGLDAPKQVDVGGTATVTIWDAWWDAVNGSHPADSSTPVSEALDVGRPIPRYDANRIDVGPIISGAVPGPDVSGPQP